jgi:hypothetical protein
MSIENVPSSGGAADGENMGKTSLAEGLRRVLDRAEGERVEIRRFFESFQEKGFGILLMIFSLPSALPVPAPGYSIPFGVVLALLALQMLARRHTPWLPKGILKVSFSKAFLEKLVPSAVAFLSRTEALVKPRFLVFTGRGMQMVPLLLVVVMAIFMMIPIPGTNTAPAMVVFMVGMGLTERDGLILCLASLAGVAATVLTCFIITYGKEWVKAKLGM